MLGHIYWKEKHISQNLIRSPKHELHTVKQIRIRLNAHDDKMRITRNSVEVETLPWARDPGMFETFLFYSG